MRRINLVSTISCVALAALAFQGCKKSNGIDNNQVITKPYTLHFVDTSGEIYYTNDGQTVRPLNTGDGFSVETITTSGEYILFRKQNSTILFASDGGEKENVNFNPVFTTINPAGFGQSVVLHVENYNDTGAAILDRIYVVSDQEKGLAINDSNGRTSTPWFYDTDPNLPAGGFTSLAQIETGQIFAFDDQTNNLYMKQDFATGWSKRNGTGLPASTDGNLYLVSMGTELYAVSVGGNNQGSIWRSTNMGNDFNQLPALPNGITDVTTAIGAFGKVLIVGTLNNGIYRFGGSNASWEQSSFGLDTRTRVYAMTQKDNLFKNEAVREYVYIATSTGVYRSDDLGQNWIKVYTNPLNKGITAIQ